MMNLQNLLAQEIVNADNTNKTKKKRLGKLMGNRQGCAHWPPKAVVVVSGHDRALGQGKAAHPQQYLRSSLGGNTTSAPWKGISYSCLIF